MSINNLEKFFESFKKNLAKQSNFEKEISFILEKYTKGKEYTFSIQENIVFIKTSPSVKQYIFLHKKEILEEILQKTTKNFSDIR